MTDYETKYRDLVAGLEALAERWEHEHKARRLTGKPNSIWFDAAALSLRALLASSPAEREGEGTAIPESVWREWHGDGTGPDAAAVRAPAPVSSGEAGACICWPPNDDEAGHDGDCPARPAHVVTPITEGGEQP